MWSPDLGRMFCNILRSGNLHVRICKQLPGNPPQFVVDIRVENEDEEGDLNIGEWICERVLPELKEVYVEGVETLCDFLSVKALDPYFQENSPGIDNLKTQHTPQELVKIKSPSDLDLNIDSVENISLSPHGCSSNKTFPVSNSLKGQTMTQLKSCVTNISETSNRKSVVNSKVNKSPSVADLLERSLATVQVSSQLSKEAMSLDVQNLLVQHSCIIDDKVEGIVEDGKSENTVEVNKMKNGCHDVRIDLEMSPFDVQTKTSLNKEIQEPLCTRTENVQEKITISRELTGDKDNLHSQSTFFSLDEVTNYNYIQCLAEKLGLNEFANFKKKHTPIMPSFISEDSNKPESTLSLLIENNDDSQLEEENDSIHSSVDMSTYEYFETLDKNLLDQSKEDLETEIFKSESNESSDYFKRELTTNTDQSGYDDSFKKSENNIVKSESIESSDNSKNEPISNTDQSTYDVSFRKSEDGIVKSQSIESSDNAKKEPTTNTDNSAYDVSCSKSEDNITSKMDNSCNNVFLYSDKYDVEADNTTTLNKYENSYNDLASGEEDKSSKTNETYYSDLSNENDSVNAVSKLEKSHDFNNKSEVFTEVNFLESEVCNANKSICGKNNKPETSNDSAFLSNKADVHSEDKSFCRSNDGENISSKISFNLINNPQAVIPRTVQPTLPFIEYPLTSTPPFYNNSPLLPVSFSPSHPPPYTFNPSSSPRPYAPPIHPPGFWPTHQTQMHFYSPFHNQVPRPPEWGNFNTFSGPNVQYVPNLKEPETMQPPYIQWSNGVNELPSQNNVHISSEPKTTPFKEKDDVESSQEKIITDNQHELSSNTNTVSEQLTELHTPSRSFASADYFSDGLDSGN